MPKAALKTSTEVKLDRKAQEVLGYLSGIPPTDEEVLTEIISVSEEGRAEFEHLLSIWLRLQEVEIKEIGRTLLEVIQRIKLSGKGVRERIESQQYFSLVRKSFRNWAVAESEERRILIRNLLVNAASRTTSPDSVLFMFIDWLDDYSDGHFQVIKEISQAQPDGLTRREIWEHLNPDREIPAEDSAEADMFKMLILDLTTGYIIRQPREKDFYGNYIRAKPTPKVAGTFESTKKYVLTELGKQFVLYALQEVPPEESEVIEEIPAETA